MKTITIDCRLWGKSYSGIGRYVQKIVSFLIQHNKGIDYYLLCSEQALSDLHMLKLSDNIHLISCKSKMFSIREQFELVRKIPLCDVFWSPYMNVPFLPIKAKKRVVTLHDVFHVANPQYYSLLKRWVVKPFYFFSVRRSDLILTVSESSKKEIETYFGHEVGAKVVPILNGCDVDIQQAFPININRKYILFVGSVKPHKNLKTALLAYEKLIEKYDVCFVIVGKRDGFITGDTELVPIVERVNMTKEKVVFTGSISDEDLYGYYKAASMLLMPSLYEGFGLPIVEAMQFGLPIACSELEVFHEIGGNSLVYFNPCDADDMMRKMELTLKMEKPIQYKPWCSWKDTAQKIDFVLKELLNTCKS